MEQESFRGRLLRLLHERPGRIIGTALGLCTGVCFVWLGFWRTLVLVLLTGIGYTVGKWIDDEGKGLKEFLEEKLPGRPDFH